MGRHAKVADASSFQIVSRSNRAYHDKSWYFAAVVLLIVSAVPVWHGYERYAQVRLHQQELLQRSVDQAVDEIHLYLRELRRSTWLFATVHEPLFRDAMFNPGNGKEHARLDHTVQASFQNVLAYLVTDRAGNPISPHARGAESEVLAMDTQDFAAFPDAHVIHFVRDKYGNHFDIVAPWGGDKPERGVFRVSFSTSALQRILSKYPTDDHQLLLLNQEIPGLVEVASERGREAAAIDGDEITRLGYTRAVDDTVWTVSGLPDAGKLTAAQRRIWQETGLTLLGFLSISMFMLFLIGRERQRLETSESQFREIAENICEVFWIYSAERQELLYVSPSYEKMFGRKVSTLQAHPHAWLDVVHPDERTRVQQSFRTNAAAGSYEVSYRVVLPDDSIRWIFDRGFPVYNEVGKVYRIVGVAQDVTERKQAEDAHNESKRALSTLMSNLPGMAYRCRNDEEWTMEFVSEGCVELTGYRSPDLIGCNKITRRQLTHVSDQEFVWSVAGSALRERKPYQIVYRIVTATGQEKWVRDQGRGIFSVDGNCQELEGFVTDITESHTLSEQLFYQASHDALTDLVNRGEFEQRLQRLLDTARATKTEHALCYLDLDQFKVINDTCGHVAGDELLRQLAGLLKEKVRKQDTLARLGGDEFGVLMERCTLTQARRVANALHKAVSGFRFLWEDKSFSVGVSIGLVPITEASEGITGVLSAADTACYAAKDQGRNRIHVYREDDTELAKRHGEMQWVARIDRALEERRLQLNYQPIVPVQSCTQPQGAYYELLLQMEDESGNAVPPGAFLPAAERYNLSTKLDCWVVGTAFEWLNAHPQHLDTLYLCSINLSGRSLGDQQFLSFVVRQLDEMNIPPQKICFEITETAAIANLSSATRFIKALKGRGCRFALDDFGSGLSSFAYLKRLPVDFLKIDGVFVQDIVKDPIGLAMVKSINDIGHVMGKQTIAEFVEDEPTLEKLREIGVDYAQGFGIGRPKPLLADPEELAWTPALKEAYN